MKLNRTILFAGLFVLLVTIPLLIFAVKQQQDLRSRATDSCPGGSYDECRKTKGTQTCISLCGAPSPTPNPETGEIPSSGQDDCTNNKKGKWCGPCGGFCITANTVTCNQAAAIKCNAQPVTGANFITGPCNATFNVPCTCEGKNICFDRGTTVQCGISTDNNGLCAVWKNSNNQTGGTKIYYCENDFSGNSCTDKLISSIPNCYCGTIQVDTPGSGYKSYQSTCSCKTKTTPTPTPTPRQRRTPTPTPTSALTPTPTETPPPGSTPTPTPAPGGPTATPTPTPTQIAAAPTPKTPTSGGPTVLGVSVIAGGVLLLLLGLAL